MIHDLCGIYMNQINYCAFLREHQDLILKLILPQNKRLHYIIIQVIFVIKMMMNFQKNYLQKYQQIYPENAEWNAIQYKLQLNLGNASAYLKRVYCVVNPYLNTQFEKDNKGHIVYDVFVEMDKMNKTDQLSGANRIQRVCQKGFQFPANQSGIQFTMGQIDVDPNQKTEYQVLMVKLCPKKSYPCYQKDFQFGKNNCPNGFQSIYYNDQNEENGLYRHRFRLYKKNQVLPYYVIQFGFNKQHQKQFKTIVCQKCSDQIATFYCQTEKVYFCKKCDYEHHKDKISAQHQRNLLNQRPILDFGTCKNHRNNKNQLFCKTCSSSMCMSCKIYGDHAQGFMASHQLSKISDYYIDATKVIEEPDPNLNKRKYQLEQLLCFLDDQIQIINQKTSELQNQLKNLFERALTKLESMSKQKLSYLMSQQLEVKRQYDFVQWMQSFLKYEKDVLPPNDFLIAWTKHQKLRKQVLNVSNIPGVTQVRPNMKIVGKIDIQQHQTGKFTGEQEVEDDKFSKKQTNKHLQKYAKSSGGKGPMPVQYNHIRSVSDFKKKLVFSNEQEQ